MNPSEFIISALTNRIDVLRARVNRIKGYQLGENGALLIDKLILDIQASEATIAEEKKLITKRADFPQKS